MAKIFIDGSAGTTGLRIHERLAGRADLQILSLPEADRKDPEARRAALAQADIAFLCLPDASAIESVALAEGSGVAIIDTSTAHRTLPGWTYGFPELTGAREAIRLSKRIANPGCHATGFIALVRPLVEYGVLSPACALSAFSLTGYTGGGKKMIGEYTAAVRDPLLDAPRQYGLGQVHKHLPEMQTVCGIDAPPLFCPIVADFPCGMEVTVPLSASMLSCGREKIAEIYKEYYKEGLVSYFDVNQASDEGGFLSAGAMAGRDDLTVSVTGNEDRILLISRFDNLGKGASGSAIQNMNLLLGLDEKTGLCV